MDVKEFQAKLNALLALAKENNNSLTVQQIREELAGTDLDQKQLLGVLKYLASQSIAIEGLDNLKGDSDDGEQAENTKEAIPLTPEEKAYLEDYLKELPESLTAEETDVLFEALAKGSAAALEKLSAGYLRKTADLAVELRFEEILLSDLIQEANLSLLQTLRAAGDKVRDEEWLLNGVREGIAEALAAQEQQKTSDDSLVARVERLEKAVRELSDDEDGQGSAFSVNELAIILDMDVEEIRSTLRLTGDDA